MWTEYYDFSRQGFMAFLPVLMGALITLFCLYGVQVVWKEKKKGEPSAKGGLIFLSLCTAFGLFWTTSIGYEIGSTYFDYLSALSQNRYQEVEGVVRNYDPRAIGRQGLESFVVGDIQIKYSRFDLFGYHKTQRRGGPIADGKYVRIYYYDGKILRLWVKD